jgi:hypothetical protein
MSQEAKVAIASLRASETMIGSAGKERSKDARSSGEERNTRIAMSSSMSPGTALSAATTSASADGGDASSASRSMATASASV